MGQQFKSRILRFQRRKTRWCDLAPIVHLVSRPTVATTGIYPIWLLYRFIIYRCLRVCRRPIMLISPTLEGLQRQLAVCSEYSEEYRLLFNSTKSKVIIRRSSRDLALPPPRCASVEPLLSTVGQIPHK